MESLIVLFSMAGRCAREELSARGVARERGNV